MATEKDEAGFYKAARRADISEGTMTQAVIEDYGTTVEVALTIAEGQMYVFRDICPHMAFPLSVGFIEGTTLECVGHGWQFNLKNGKAIYPPIRKGLTFYEWREVGEEIWVKIDPFF